MGLLGISERQLREKIKEKVGLTDEEAERAIAIIREVAGNDGKGKTKTPSQPLATD